MIICPLAAARPLLAQVDQAALVAQGAPIETRVYGSSAASLSSASLMTAVAGSAFPSAGINVDVHFHSE